MAINETIFTEILLTVFGPIRSNGVEPALQKDNVSGLRSRLGAISNSTRSDTGSAF